MDVKLVLVVIFALVGLQDVVLADFWYNRVTPKLEELDMLGMICAPGRTIIKMKEKPVEQDREIDGYSEEEDSRRSHMRFSTEDESCQVCVCSVEAKDEYCSNRPAMNVNECMRMAVLMSKFQRNEPFDHERTLSYMIRRDLIWHGEEIPTPTDARCNRGRSYYSNSPRANDTDMDLPSDVDTLLDYKNKKICWFCVCSTAGHYAGCIHRSPWYCKYYRDLRSPDAPRHRYKTLFQQDRPAYFRQLSWRLRRTMDNGMFDFIENVGDGSTNANTQKCTPFVSMYSDCTDENRCQGCNQCTCSASGRWECRTVTEGCQETPEEGEVVNEQLIDSALTEMMQQLKMQKEGKKVPKKIFVPKPLPPSETILVRKVSNKIPAWDELESEKEEEEKFAFENLEVRKKRSVENEKSDKKSENQTITFHHTVDDINEDTLQNTNASGTLQAAKVDMIPIASRRSVTSNGSTSLQIDYKPPLQNNHAADNKVDTAVLHDDQVDLLVHHKIYEIVGNKTQAARDKDLSKLVVNELKSGVTETIGDKESLPISNITFAPENDTLTAMAFIAGNLLNKLWNMEKNNDDSLETDNLKHNKIKDLLELFKEPLNLRQETFLKNALQYLATAIENKSIGNSSICENIEELKRNSGIVDAQKVINPSLLEDQPTTETYTKETLKTVLPQIEKKIAAAEALNKINHVLDLIKKYERTQNSLNDLKHNINTNSTVRKSLDGKNEKARDLTGEEKTTLTIFGKLLETLTKLILPHKKGKQLRKNVKNKNVLTSDTHFKDKLIKLNLTDKSLTTKDKIIVDYLTHIQNNPRCLLNKHLETLSLPEFEGDIMQKLSDFFAINTMSDLSKLLNGVNNQKENFMRTLTTEFGALSLEETVYTTDIISRTILTTPTPLTTTTTEKDNSLNKFESTKAKLKDHLKTILQDLVELQNMGGKSVNTKNIEVADALPCIYNLLNDKILNNAYDNMNHKPNHRNKKITDPIHKVTEIITSLKNELKRTAQTRRSNVDIEKRPKSAIVWERTVSNLGNINKIDTRRTPQSNSPIFFTDLKTTIDNIENSRSNTYKSIAYLAKVPAAERLLLLKTLSLDTTKYITILNEIKQFVDKSTMLPSEQYTYLSEFIETVDNDLNLNGKVVNSLDQPKQTFISKKTENTMKTLKPYDTQKIVDKFETVKIGAKLTRDQIINQLIKNRMLLYLKQKEQTGDRKGEINVDLAKKIVLHLEVGDSNLARELFKIFVSQQIRDSTKNSGVPFTDPSNYETNQEKMDKKRSQILEPLVQFEETKESRGSWLDQEQLLKQLMSIKNMRV